jgi:hypothetical protein
MTKLPVPRVVVPVLCITQTRSAELLLRGRPLRRALGRRRRSIFCVEPWMYSSCRMLRPGELRASN